MLGQNRLINNYESQGEVLKMKVKPRFLIIGLVVLSLVAAFAVFAASAFAAPAPNAIKLSWNDSYSGKGLELKADTSARTDASGDKIASNAQSADFPGLYFRWDDKQKDDGVLLVSSDVFSWFKDGKFVITAKNSNNYWDYQITEASGVKVDTINGQAIYAYQIPKQFQVLDNKGKAQTESLKNINMVFISGNWRTYTVDIQKVWLDRDGNPTTKPAFASATFTNGYALGKTTVRLYANDTYPVNFTENAVNRHDFVSVSVNGDVSHHNNVDLTAQEGKTYTIVFTNRCNDATLNIVKNWNLNGLYDELPAGLAATFTNGYVVGDNQTLPAGTEVNFSENPNDWSDIVLIGGIQYKVTTELQSITVNGHRVSQVDFTADKYRNYTVVFTNKLVATKLLPDPTYTVNKVWLDADGITPVDPSDYPGLTQATFNGGTILAGDTVTAQPFDQISVSEDPLNWTNTYSDSDFTYTEYFILVATDVNGNPVDSVDFAAEDGTDYVITFTNQLQIDAVPNTTPPETTIAEGKIPSTQHYDRWWNDYGVLCYAGNTTHVTGEERDYFVAFADGFWDNYSEVSIGFGTKNNILFTMTFTKDGLLDDSVPGGVIPYEAYTIPLSWGSHYSNGAFLGTALDGVWFADPFNNGAGAEQAWFMELTK